MNNWWRTKPDDKVRFGHCPVCGKSKIKKKYNGARMYCEECDVWFDSKLTPFSVAINSQNQ